MKANLKEFIRRRIEPGSVVYIDFSNPMEIDGSIKDVDSADDLTAFLNYHLEKLDEKVL